MTNDALRTAWENAIYRWTCIYVAVIVTAIFALQIHRYFFALPASCVRQESMLALVPVLGVFV